MAAQGTSSATDTVSATGEQQSSGVASQAKDKVSGLGRAAADKIDDNRDGVAGGLETAAATLHEKAESLPGGEKISDIAHSAADKLSTTANYVRGHDVNSMMADVQELVKKNPGPALLVSAALGFLVARAFSSRD
jgi:ElaB/YqjD/DUF883 family membrane-anchored ribosome-binding protein